MSEEVVGTTEQSSLYNDLEKMETMEILKSMNREDKSVPMAIEEALEKIEVAVEEAIKRVLGGGRIFYIGAGTSGRFGIVDASEILPTFGVDGLFIGLIAGGDNAIRTPVEHAEDSLLQGWEDMQKYSPTNKDMLFGIAASGRTPYVIGAVQKARENGLATSCITCNRGSKLAMEVDHPIEVIVGPEFLTGSTRLKSGTAQKLVLNMISTSIMIRIGKVKGNKMVDMRLSNNKLKDRGVKMVLQETDITDYDTAKSLLLQYGNVRDAISNYNSSKQL